MNKNPFLVKRYVLVPIRNEANTIHDFLNWLRTQLPFITRVFLIDGASTDGTSNILKKFASSYPDKVTLIENPDKYVPHGLNRALKHLISANILKPEDIVIRLDVHTTYHPDYICQILQSFSRWNNPVVGPLQRTTTTAKNALQQAIAIAMTHPLGVGGSKFHYREEAGPAHTVYLGAWRGIVFLKAGLFDTDLIRNQDDEFHARVRRHGFTVWLDPSIYCWYHPRSSLIKLWKQYFQYGLYKPLALWKSPAGFRWHHPVPAVFLLYITTLPAGIWLVGSLWLLPLLLYLALILTVSLITGRNRRVSWRVRFLLPVTFATMHLAYGSGFIIGIIKPILRLVKGSWQL